MARMIAIGDVHGCAAELEELLNLLKPQAEDRFFFLGDLVNKGPDSHRCVELARALPNSVCVLGNHEARLLAWKKNGKKPPEKASDRATVKQLTDDDWAYLRTFPLKVYLETADLVFVHGGFLPDRPWQEQGAEIVTEIQVIDPKGKPARQGACPEGTPWADTWQGRPFVFYGHTPRREVYERPGSLGLDTGCVYGNKLSACILPGGKIIQVPARKAYAG